ncbi:hirsutellin A [Fusarium sp. NRRL 25303]|nr:hirsutellin A [Fusarium sp. NRRL 25303]
MKSAYVAVAKAQAKEAGPPTSKSGDPHHYHNGDNIIFGVHNCDKEYAILWEYPIYWVDKEGAEWKKDVKIDKQKQGSNPIRVVSSKSKSAVE